ncbi:hypothetical protein [Metapseudomonas resinovorans]|uniref:Uncharacterized protein n=1 Tax=Metapseudomonas resinovorans NBRC 106553 TaxID=1245471 RepID=S6BAH5_METRE|nr:hypothetical protein [Pseudomonas resinovorans]BAN46029.1 hypothetical protein PCA10_02970 [Pseudomonas resinovorans NBRC 106553]
MNYYELSSLNNIYLEDSYVLEIEEKENTLIFKLEAVLTENNPSYTPPRAGEQYCYSKATLGFYGIHLIKWLERNRKEFPDKTEKNDYGNIDIFRIEDGTYILSGDWGVVEIDCDSIEFKLEKFS